MSDINNKQKGLIKMAQKQVGMTDPDYRLLLKEMFDVTSCTELSYDQASRLIDELKQRGFEIKKKAAPRRPTGKNVTHMASPAQFALIGKLEDQVAWRLRNGFDCWLRKVINTEKIKTSTQASKVIEGLKFMAKRYPIDPIKMSQEEFQGRVKGKDPF